MLYAMLSKDHASDVEYYFCNAHQCLKRKNTKYFKFQSVKERKNWLSKKSNMYKSAVCEYDSEVQLMIRNNINFANEI